MSRKIGVISGSLDGAELQREQKKNKLFVRCKGKDDDKDIQDAMESCSRDGHFSIDAEDWERIFGE